MKLKELAKIIINNKGNFSTSDCEQCNVPFHYFLQLSQLSNDKLINVAQTILTR